MGVGIFSTRFVSPFSQFEQWYAEARSLPLGNPTAMVLATADEQGRPSMRVVLLKQWNIDGFVFYTNLKSKKAQNLAVNPHASLLFFWDDLGKQIRIEGRVEEIPREASELYFHSRPRESQWGAWASEQSQQLDSYARLNERYDFYREKYPDRVPLPDFWGGYILIPDYFEFWQSSKYRLHHRLVFERKNNKWVAKLLYP